MPVCEGSPEFTDDELLYRRLRSDWLEPDGSIRVAGISGPMFPSPIDLPACSVDRELLAGGLEGVLSRAKSIETAVAAIAVRDVPAEFEHKESPIRYTGLVVYRPTALNAAHSEIWVRHPDEQDEPEKTPGGAFKLKMRTEIAKRMTVVHPPPRPLADPSEVKIIY